MKNRFQFTLICLFIFLFQLNVIAQNFNVDEYNSEKALYFSNKNYDSLLIYAEKLQLSQNYCRKLTGILYESKVFYKKGYYNKSKDLLFQMMEDISSLNINTCNYNQSKYLIGKNCEECIQVIKLNIYRKLFYIDKASGNYDEAFENLINLQKIIEALPDKNQYYYKNKIETNQSLALLNIKLGYNEKGLEILKKANKDINRIKIKRDNIWYENFILQKANILNSIGDLYMNIYEEKEKNNLSLLDSVSIYYKKSYDTVNLLQDQNLDNRAIYQLRMIDLFIEKKDYNLALFHINRFDSVFKKNNYKNNLLLYKSEIYRYQKKFDSSIVSSKMFINHSDKENLNTKNLISVYNNLTNSYLAQKNNDSAIKYSNLTLTKLNELNKKEINVSAKIHTYELKEIIQINKELVKKRNRSILFRNLLLGFIFILILTFFIIKKRFAKIKKVRSNLNKEFVKEVLERLSQFEKTKLYLDNDFTINVLAKYLYTNTTYLSIIINTHKQQSFKQYLSSLRINHVKERLINEKKLKNYSIDAIAKESGYSGASSFTRAFKKNTGITPAEYIRNL